jgi:carboxylate-amine ligase
MCDGVNTLDEVCAVAAFIQSLVAYLQDLYDAGEPLPSLKGWTLKENKWRATRFGLDAHIIRNENAEQIHLHKHLCDWVEKLTPTATTLGCKEELLHVRSILQHKPSYERQRRIFAQTGSLQDVIQSLTHEFYHNKPV